jgi:hypothetical protein
MPRAQTAAKVKTVTMPIKVERKPGLQWEIDIDVEWATLSMDEARQAYAELKKHFDRAGAILNARIMDTDGRWVCFMAGKKGCCKMGVVHSGNPRGVDYSYVDPVSKLSKPAKICSELCWIRFQQQLIDERRERNNPAVNG